MARVRVAALQYFIRPITSFEEFARQVDGLVQTAADYNCQLLVFPEYFTLQLLTLADIRQPIRDQVRRLASQEPPFVELMERMARQYNMYIVAGTIPSITGDSGQVKNLCHVFGPSGGRGTQGKLHMTRFEIEDWGVSPDAGLHVFDTSFAPIAVAVCYDVEFPEVARAFARMGAHILVVPSCTDDRQGFLRVRYCAQARAIENQMYVVHASLVGSLPMVPAVSLNYGQSAILTPSDFPFARDGILAEGIPNQETMIIAELNLETIGESRERGTVIPLEDSRRTHETVSTPRLVSL